MLTTLYWIGAILFIAIFAALGLIGWIARGSADVNGDPERDSGEPLVGPVNLRP